MQILTIVIILAYLGINLLIGGGINTYITPGISPYQAVASINALIIAAGLVLVELSLPKRLKTIQVLLSVVVVICHVGPSANARIVAQGLFAIMVLIKFYAFYLVIRNIRDRIQGKVKPVQTSGKDFYNSTAWRKLRYTILNEQGRCCVSCGENRVKDHNGKMISYHVDHIKPRSLYPHLALDPNNMQVMCEACNLGKSNHWDIDHREERGIA